MIYVNFAKLEHENDLVSFINKVKYQQLRANYYNLLFEFSSALCRYLYLKTNYLHF